MEINRSLFKNILYFLAFFELFSLISFVYPTMNSVVFFVLLIITLVISLKNLKWGLYIVLTELIVGSFGQLFSFDMGGFSISLRIGLFIVIMAVWATQSISQLVNKSVSFNDLFGWFKTNIGKWYIALAIVVLWGIINGLLNNDTGNVFFDANNWLYFLYVVPFYTTFITSVNKNDDVRIKNYEQKQFINHNSYLASFHDLFTVIIAASVVLAAQTIILEYFFAHQIPGTIEMLYQWVRDFRLGEITFYARNFYRVFLQSQIWLLFSFFILLSLLVTSHTLRVTQGEIGFKKNDLRKINALLILCTIALLISFSRSLWVGWIAGLGVFFVVLCFKLKCSIKQITKYILMFVGGLIIAGVFVFLLINVPPVKDQGQNFGSLFSSRVSAVDAAGSSRINLLQPLKEGISVRPIMGSGFGSTITYHSADPRILEQTAGASGEYTTYAFEWSYLDMWLKFGFIGVLVYLCLLVTLLMLLWRKISYLTSYVLRLTSQKEISDIRYQTSIYVGMFLSLVSLMVINVFTPFLNHPLGIGLVILATVSVLQNKDPQLPMSTPDDSVGTPTL